MYKYTPGYRIFNVKLERGGNNYTEEYLEAIIEYEEMVSVKYNFDDILKMKRHFLKFLTFSITCLLLTAARTHTKHIQIVKLRCARKNFCPKLFVFLSLFIFHHTRNSNTSY